MKKKPSGYVAKCQCGVYIGALDRDRTPPADMAKILGKWLWDGCIVEPRFGNFGVQLETCKCG